MISQTSRFLLSFSFFFFLVDGSWSEWSKLSSCSTKCGNGTSTRLRSCLGPFYGGKPCIGESLEESVCFEAPCPGTGSSINDVTHFFKQFSIVSPFPLSRLTLLYFLCHKFLTHFFLLDFDVINELTVDKPNFFWGDLETKVWHIMRTWFKTIVLGFCHTCDSNTQY